ncbi:MAG: RDD family protein [Sulfurovum sp.]|nr:RDD family protein [Sulfurovaceae bacterium]
MKENIQLVPAKKRIWSFVIDDLVVSFLFIIIFWQELSSFTTAEELTGFLNQTFIIIILIKVIYQTLFVWQNGMTLGKYITKMKVISLESGERPSLKSSLIRALVRVISETLFYIGFMMAFFNPLVQTLHDKLSKCVVVDA